MATIHRPLEPPLPPKLTCNFALPRMLVAGVGTVRVPVADEAHVDAVAVVAAELALRTLQGAVHWGKK